ncbi:unnamed protein product [Trichobilharzia regenti]|nr:unnamed protein product [Trichobilharzia regenti]
MPSNPHAETYGSIRSKDGSETRLSTITNRYYGVPSTIIHLIQQLYDNAACQIQVNNNNNITTTIIIIINSSSTTV